MLKPVGPGLRVIHHNSNSTSHVQVSVPAGDELTVSDDVAEQLLAVSPQFRDATPAKPPAKSPVKKAAAKA